MDYLALQNNIKRGLFAPVYLFYGEETYLQEKALADLKEKLLPPGTGDFNLDILDGREVSADTVARVAGTMPFMGEKRLVIVRDTHFFKARSKGKGEEPGADDKDLSREASLLEYLANPSPYTCLVFVTGEGVDKRKKLFKQVAQRGQAVEFTPLKGKDLRIWLAQKIGQLGKKIEPQALMILAEGGFSLQQLEKEMEKLVTFTGDNPVISLEDVEEVCVRNLENTIFELVDALGEKKASKAIEVLHNLLFEGESPHRILPMIARQFRLLLRAKAMVREGYAEKQVAAGLQVHPYVAQKILKQGRNFTEEALRGAMAKILEGDFALKTGRQSPPLLLELLILDLMH